MDLTSRLKLPLHSLEEELPDLVYPGEVAGQAGVETRELSPATASAGWHDAHSSPDTSTFISDCNKMSGL